MRKPAQAAVAAAAPAAATAPGVRRGVVWAAGGLLSRVREVGVVGLEAELEERRACQREISARISGTYKSDEIITTPLLALADCC